MRREETTISWSQGAPGESKSQGGQDEARVKARGSGPPVEEEGGAGAFGGDHGGAEGIVGGTAGGEVGAIARLEFAEEDGGGGAFCLQFPVFIKTRNR